MGSAQFNIICFLRQSADRSIVLLLFECLDAVLHNCDLVTQFTCIEGRGSDACVCCDSREEDIFSVCLLESVVECCLRECGVVGLCYARVMCMEEEANILVDLYAWSVGDTDTAGMVSSGKVEFETRLRWIFGRHFFLFFE